MLFIDRENIDDHRFVKVRVADSNPVFRSIGTIHRKLVRSVALGATRRTSFRWKLGNSVDGGALVQASVADEAEERWVCISGGGSAGFKTITAALASAPPTTESARAVVSVNFSVFASVPGWVARAGPTFEASSSWRSEHSGPLTTVPGFAGFVCTIFDISMATELLQAGVALALVSQRLDHQRKSTTSDYYAHAVPSGDAHAVDVMRSIIDNV